tara:strand:+ start:1458 stop:2249 length:792 start_codon:yes stop_codon:yes gene_type:complete
MTTFDKIAQQMRQQGMSEAKIRKWGKMGQAPVASLRKQKPTQPPNSHPPTHKDSRGNAPSRQAIATYWATKCEEDLDALTDEQRSEFFQTPSFERKMARQDWGEPCCWACGWYKDDQADYGVSHFQNPLVSWERVDWLEKCHIIPHMLGGSNDVSNFVLLCKRCHKEAPDNKRARHMKRFIANRPNYYGEQIKMMNAVPHADLQLASQHAEIFKIWCFENVGYHAGGDNRQSMVSAIEDFAEDYRAGLITPEYIEGLKEKYEK